MGTGKTQIGRNLQQKAGQESASRTKNLVQNFVSKAYGQSALGIHGQRKTAGNRSLASAMSNKTRHQAPAQVRSLHIDLTGLEEKEKIAEAGGKF